MTLRTVHVGVGGRGIWPVSVMGKDPRFEPVALVDKNPEALAGAAEHLSLPESARFADFDDALSVVEADACIICTPTHLHAGLCRAAFASGLHVVVEKGMTTDWSEAVALVEEAEAAGVRFCVAQNYRFSATEQTISALLADPEHPHHPGQAQIVDYINHRYRPHPLNLNYPFAMVWDMGCHHVDSLSCWCGSAVSVTARSSNPPWSRYEHDADIAAVIEYESGVICHYVLTHAATLSRCGLVLQGERGALRAFDVPGVQFHPLPAATFATSLGEACQLLEVPSPEECIADAFYRYVCEGIEPGISGRQNLKTLAVCEMLMRSALEGRTVHAEELNRPRQAGSGAERWVARSGD